MNQHTCILYFARTPDAELKYKYRSKYKGLQKSLVAIDQAIVNTLRKSGKSIQIVRENQQVGSTFGQRITNAISSVGKLGYENIVVVGNDCLQLSEQSLINACESLENNTAVLGKTLDGGSYLIGLKYSAFDAVAFEQLPWNTPHLAASLLSNFNASSTYSSVDLLQEALDIDSVYQFKVALDLPLSTALRKALLKFISYSRILCQPLEQSFECITLGILYSRPPPLEMA